MGRAYNVVDADGHILEPLDLWDRYIDPEFRERRPRFVIDENGKERLSVEGKLLGNPRGIGSLGSVGARQGIVKAGTLKYAEGRRGGFDPHARIVDMDADGIDAAFLYPSLGLFAGAVEDPGLAAAMCRAYNRWLADYCAPYPERLFGVAMLPMQSVELAVDEMRYAREKLGMRFVELVQCFLGARLRVGEILRQVAHLLDEAAADLVVVVVEAERERLAIHDLVAYQRLDELRQLFGRRCSAL